MKINYSDGSSKDARILSLVSNIMRAAVKDGDDAVQFRLLNGKWFSEELEEVSFEFPLLLEIPPGSAMEIARIGRQLRMATVSASDAPRARVCTRIRHSQL